MKSLPAPSTEEIITRVKEQLGAESVDAIYRQRVLSQRTRRYQLNASHKPIRIEILHTLLGIELKLGRRRLRCPDLATARYLSVFARLGCDAVGVPYDITRISIIADELESSWRRMLVLADHLTAGRSERLRNLVRRRLIRDMRAAIETAGAGRQYPPFEVDSRS